MDNYIEQATKTSIPGTYPIHLDAIDRSDFDRAFNGFAAASAAAEKLKKQIFYGRELSRIPTIVPATLGFDGDVESLHANLGIMGESGELAEANTREEVMLEAGDLLWYIAKKLKRFDLTFDEVQEANIAKLRLRFPDKFTAEAANAGR